MADIDNVTAGVEGQPPADTVTASVEGTQPSTASQPVPAAPAKPSLWRGVLTGALAGLANSGGAKSFGGGLGAGAAGELNAQAETRAQTRQASLDAQNQQAEQVKIANLQAETVKTMGEYHNLPPSWQDSQSEKLADLGEAQMKAGIYVPAAPAVDNVNEATDQAHDLFKKDPSQLHTVIPVRGQKGKLTYQVVNVPNSPTQADTTIDLPDGTKKTIPAGSMKSADVYALQLASVKQSIANQSTKGAAAKAPTTKVMGDKTVQWNPDTKTWDPVGPRPTNSGDVLAGTKTQQMVGDDGFPTVFAFNPKTNKYDVPQGVSSTGAYGHEESQAGAVIRAGNGLVDDLTANKAQLGTLQAWVKSKGLNTPIADPKLANLQAKLATFAALQPAMHAFRSHSALETFDAIVGGLQKNPDATIQSIKGILSTSGSILPKVKLRAPDGSVKEVSADEAPHFVSKGAKVVR